MMKLLFVVSLWLVQEAMGHGAMWYPNPWMSASECPPAYSAAGCEWTASLTEYFTNYTKVEKQTLPDEMLNNVKRKTVGFGLHPWNAPGTAPTFGNGCGAQGGNPDGCHGNRWTPLNGEDKDSACCGGKMGKNGKWIKGCGGNAGGRLALDQYQDGFFGTPITTTWERGSEQEVIWQTKAYHRGGYAYRLCKVNDGKVWEVTEKCFQDGHLKFAGDTTWTYWQHEDGETSADWESAPIVIANEGTTPPGSEWCRISVPKHMINDRFWTFKNLVAVPEDLEPGQYVLSFRWDCQQSPQVWNSCANIEIV